jgi:hypothetical protein
VAFGDHLCADQDVDLTTVHSIEGGLCASLAASRVGIDAQ